jgi:YVTN family beta-propeller protein
MNNSTNTVSMLDAATGAPLRTIPVGPHPAVAVVDDLTGRVFVVHGRAGTRGTYSTFNDYQQVGVTMLDARTGAVLRSLPVGGSTANDFVGQALGTNITVDARRGRVFVINQVGVAQADQNHGTISVLDATSGRVLRTIGVGRHPISLTVDESTDRLFVVNTNLGCHPGACHGSVTVIDTARL